MKNNKITRRNFLASTTTIAAGSLLVNPFNIITSKTRLIAKTRIALVGTGVRGVGMFGKRLLKDYGGYVEFVGLCDINPGRLKYAKSYIGVDCPTYTDFDKMMIEKKPEKVIVTTIDSQHHKQVIRGMELGADIICEKPMTTDEDKAQAILDAEKKTGKKVTVTFNYRYSPHRAKIKEIIDSGKIGTVTSVDFNWYLNTEHGPRYFRRWHAYRKNGGTLLVHKSTHHFDLVNWWLNTDPEEVFGYGDLEFFGKNGAFRSDKCRSCPHKDKCEFYWDIYERDHLVKLYVENEKYDGYIRDACIYREDIDIFDKMAVQVKYANNAQMSYSLTTYSPYEGYRIAFNGTKGRLEAWIQEKQTWPMNDYDELMLTLNFKKPEYIRIPHAGGGHGGGDTRMLDKLFKDPDMPDPLKQSAGTRDGAMSILTGIAARKSIDTGKPVKIESLTELKPHPNRSS